jgi:hypothetical protein
MNTTRTRRTAAWAGILLVVALLPLVGPTAPAHAVAGCLTEEAPTADPLPIPTGPGCDDSTPPVTTIGTVTPPPNGEGWIRTDQISFTFSGAHTDADADPISYQCQFYNTATAPADWTTCTSPAVYTDLAETTVTPYTFKVRAVDTADDGIDLTTDILFPVDTDEADFDQTPAQQVVRVDTVVPNSFVFGGPVDTDGSGSPITRKPQVSYLVNASEKDVTYRCQLDGRNVRCDQGKVTLGGLTGGDRVFQVKVADRAGNEDRSAATKQFTVPYDLPSAKSWKLVKAKGSFKGRELQTRLKGARIQFRAQNVREFRFLAPAGSGLGRLRVRVGQGAWTTFDLGRPKASRSRYYVVRDASSPLYSGPVLIESLSAGKPVRVDALVFPPG